MARQTPRLDAPLSNPDDEAHRRQIALRANAGLSKDGGNGMQVPLLLKSVLEVEIIPAPPSTSLYYPPLWPGGVVYVSDLGKTAYCNGVAWFTQAAATQAGYPSEQAVFTASGTIIALPGVYGMKITGIAPGGGGGGIGAGSGPGAAGGGGPGEVRVAYIRCNPGDSFTLLIGSLGAGGPNSATGGAPGGDVSVGTAGAIMICKGGGGGGGAFSNSIGTNGGTPAGSGGSLLPPAGLASNGMDTAQGASQGGSTLYGNGGFITSTISAAGANAAGPGGGGSGAVHGAGNQSSAGGGNGFAGRCIVEYYKAN